VVVCRLKVGAPANPHPLIFDPATNAVTICEPRFSPTHVGLNTIRVVGDDLYFTSYEGISTPHRYSRFNLSSLSIEVLGEDAPGGYVHFHGDDVYVLGNRLWRKRPGGNFEPLVSNVPWNEIHFDPISMGRTSGPPQLRGPYRLTGIQWSAHHGLVAVITTSSPSEHRAYVLEIPIK
jgi:hypothetical protein